MGGRKAMLRWGAAHAATAARGQPTQNEHVASALHSFAHPTYAEAVEDAILAAVREPPPSSTRT